MKGSIEVIAGPMFAYKSTELLRRVRRHEIAGKRVRVCRPKKDTRDDSVHTHDGLSKQAVEVKDMFDALYTNSDYDMIAVDEVQFLNIGYGDPELIFDLANRGVTLVFAGLDTDHFGEGFLSTAMLMGLASDVQKLKAVCLECGGQDACRTQWISDLPYNENTRIGGKDKYAPKCLDCFRPMDLDGEERLTIGLARTMIRDHGAEVIQLRP